MDNKLKRNESMDALRIIACFMVIMVHITPMWKYDDIHNLHWTASVIYDSMCRSTVPLFFMLSGAFFHEKNILPIIKKVIYFTAVFLITSITYSLIDLALNLHQWKDLTDLNTYRHIKYILLHASTEYTDHLWYLPAYRNVLILSPFVLRIIEHDDSRQKKLKWMIFVFAVLNSLYATFRIAFRDSSNALVQAVFENHNEVLLFITRLHLGYWLLGRFLIDKKFGKRTQTAFCFLFLLSTASLILLTVKASVHTGHGDMRWQETQNIVVMCSAISLFIIAKFWQIPDRLKGIVRYLSKQTFGIYLTHVFFINTFQNAGIFGLDEIFHIKVNAFISIPLRALLVFLSSLLVVTLYHKAASRLRVFLQNSHSK